MLILGNFIDIIKIVFSWEIYVGFLACILLCSSTLWFAWSMLEKFYLIAYPSAEKVPQSKGGSASFWSIYGATLCQRKF